MRSLVLSSLILSAAAIPRAVIRDARAAEGHIYVAGGTAPERQDLVPKHNDYAPGSKRSKVRYGPYILPSIKDTTLLATISGEPGTMTGLSLGLTKPCDDGCSLLNAQAGLEYADGKVADTADGAWLHHIVLLVAGLGRSDSTCWLFPAERFFSSGNERTPVAMSDLANKKIKSAYQLFWSDSIVMQYELMNMIETAQTVYVTMDYEYIPGKLPEGWKATRALWFDVTGCPSISFVIPPKDKTKFTLNASPWTSWTDADMLSVGGHLHDGGSNVEIYMNDKLICDSQAKYEVPAKPGNATMVGMPGMQRSVGHGPDEAKGAHIARMTVCQAMGPMKKGDKVRIDAKYDYDQYEGMKTPQGSYATVMGISIMYIATDP